MNFFRCFKLINLYKSAKLISSFIISLLFYNVSIFKDLTIHFFFSLSVTLRVILLIRNFNVYFFLVFKVNSDSALEEFLSSTDECYDFCMCNPPFFENIEEIRRKRRYFKETIADSVQKEEIVVDGGEVKFVRNILKESLIYQDRIWFELIFFFLQVDNEI